MRRATLLLALLALLAVLFASCVGGLPGAAQRDIYLPWMPQPVATSPLPTPTATPDPQAQCFHDERALAFYRLLIDDPRQQRPALDCSPALVAAAGWRSWGLAHGDPWSHTDANGVTPNEYARQAGCKLPWDYAAKGNNIESLVAGSPDVAVMFAALARSPAHADHLFGRNDFFRAQRHVGIAVAEGGELGWYWVVMIGQCE